MSTKVALSSFNPHTDVLRLVSDHSSNTTITCQRKTWKHFFIKLLKRVGFFKSYDFTTILKKISESNDPELNRSLHEKLTAHSISKWRHNTKKQKEFLTKISILLSHTSNTQPPSPPAPSSIINDVTTQPPPKPLPPIPTTRKPTSLPAVQSSSHKVAIDASKTSAPVYPAPTRPLPCPLSSRAGNTSIIEKPLLSTQKTSEASHQVELPHLPEKPVQIDPITPETQPLPQKDEASPQVESPPPSEQPIHVNLIPPLQEEQRPPQKMECKAHPYARIVCGEYQYVIGPDDGELLERIAPYLCGTSPDLTDENGARIAMLPTDYVAKFVFTEVTNASPEAKQFLLQQEGIFLPGSLIRTLKEKDSLTLTYKGTKCKISITGSWTHSEFEVVSCKSTTIQDIIAMIELRLFPHGKSFGSSPVNEKSLLVRPRDELDSLDPLTREPKDSNFCKKVFVLQDSSFRQVKNPEEVLKKIGEESVRALQLDFGILKNNQIELHLPGHKHVALAFPDAHRLIVHQYRPEKPEDKRHYTREIDLRKLKTDALAIEQKLSQVTFQDGAVYLKY